MGCLLSYPGDGTEVSKSFADEELVDVFSASNHCLSGKLGLHTYRPDVHLQLISHANGSNVKMDLFPGKGLQHEVLSPFNVEAQKVNSRISKCQNEALERQL